MSEYRERLLDDAMLAVRAMSHPLNDFLPDPSAHVTNKQKHKIRWRAAVERITGNPDWKEAARQYAKNIINTPPSPREPVE